jgi:hypothetical protein
LSAADNAHSKSHPSSLPARLVPELAYGETFISADTSAVA